MARTGGGTGGGTDTGGGNPRVQADAAAPTGACTFNGSTYSGNNTVIVTGSGASATFTADPLTVNGAANSWAFSVRTAGASATLQGDASVFIAAGSNARAIYNAIRQARDFASSGFIADATKKALDTANGTLAAAKDALSKATNALAAATKAYDDLKAETDALNQTATDQAALAKSLRASYDALAATPQTSSISCCFVNVRPGDAANLYKSRNSFFGST